MDPRPGPQPRPSVLPWLIALAAFMLSMTLATTFPLLDPDEGRNAEVAREMAASGDLLVPHLAGMPYLDKPPAFFWATAAAIRIAGNEPWAARLPAALAAALTLALVTRFAQRRAGRAFAMRAAALLYTAPLFAVLSAYVIFDMPLALCVTAVWLGLAAELAEGAGGRRRLWMFAAVTAGVLLKGPVMLAWAAGGSLGGALLFRSRAPLRWLAWWPGWLLVLGVAGGWFALASARYPEYPRYAFLEETFERLASGSFRREQPWWFVPAVLAGGALPWSLATPWWHWRRRSTEAFTEAESGSLPAPGDAPPGSGAGDASASGQESLLSTESRLGLGFVLFAVVFFTLSHSKLVTYLLPALPMLAWTAAEAWSDAERVHSCAWGLAVVYALLAAGLAVAGFGPWLASAPPPFDSAAFPAKLLAGCFAYVVLRSVASALGRPERAFVGVLLFTPVVLLAAGPPLLRYAASQSGEPLARSVAATTPGGRVRFEACYSPGTDFVLGRRSALVSALGRETTSNYQLRYRGTLVARGQWTPLAAPGYPPGYPRGARVARVATRVDVVVRPVRQVAEPPAGYMPFFRDERFVAYVKR
jgi:4-amino-4-deoxy-L-arabinose transferase-like glycosyltransferase